MDKIVCIFIMAWRLFPAELMSTVTVSFDLFIYEIILRKSRSIDSLCRLPNSLSPLLYVSANNIVVVALFLSNSSPSSIQLIRWPAFKQWWRNVCALHTLSIFVYTYSQHNKTAIKNRDCKIIKFSLVYSN